MIPSIALLIATLLQVLVARRLRPTRFVGDEGEYCLKTAELRKKKPWIRVPLYRVLVQAWILLGYPRVGTSVMSLMAVGLAVGFVQAQAGGLAAVLTAILLVVNIERMVLALHIWPDILLGLLLVGMGVLLHHYSATTAIPLAVVAAIALGVRIEAAAYCALAGLCPLLLADASAIKQVMPALICLAAAIGYTAYNGIAHGKWRLDTTVGFNVAVAKTELSAPEASVSALMKRTVATQNGVDPGPVDEGSLKTVLAQAFGRTKSLLGPETFVSQRLMQTNGPGYVDPDWLAQPGIARSWLRYGTTVGFLATLFVLPSAPVKMAVLFGFATLLYCGLQTRSRYRMVLLPLQAVLFGLGAAQCMSDPSLLHILAGLGLDAMLIAVLVFARSRNEV